MKRLFLIYFLTLLMVFGRMRAQQLVLKTYDRSSGLASDYVLCMMQDRNGFIWFGTDRGISRYDGKMFTTYTAREGLPDNFITTMFQDKDGFLWFGTYEGGISRFDGKSFLSFSTRQGLTGNSIREITQDKFGRMYILTEAGLTVFYQNNYSSLHFKNNIIHMVMNEEEKISIYTPRFWYRIIPTNDKTILYQRLENKLLYGSTSVKGLSNALRNRFNADLCIGFSNNFQLVKFHNDTSFQTVRKYRKGNIAAIVDGLDSTLWCGTLADGIAEVDETNAVWYDTRHGLAQRRVEAMIRDYEGNIWISTFGSGVQKLSGSYVRSFKQPDGLPDNHV
ncbi:MAG: hypothetical protein HYZ34_08920, partial [Ignavibacteriae bacterium]|nr:hypothetical protein [Ignavibacteriota bacterium]